MQARRLVLPLGSSSKRENVVAVDTLAVVDFPRRLISATTFVGRLKPLAANLLRVTIRKAAPPLVGGILSGLNPQCRGMVAWGQTRALTLGGSIPLPGTMRTTKITLAVLLLLITFCILPAVSDGVVEELGEAPAYAGCIGRKPAKIKNSPPIICYGDVANRIELDYVLSATQRQDIEDGAIVVAVNAAQSRCTWVYLGTAYDEPLCWK